MPRQILMLLFLFPLLIAAQNSVVDSIADDGAKELEAAFNNPGVNFPQKPTNYVTDEAGLLTADQQEALNTKLRNFEKNTTAQLAIYICRTLNNENINEVCLNIFNTWGLGQKEKNNGLLIAIFVNDRQYRIQTGRGFDNTFPSDFLKKIQEEHINPHFREGNFYVGIDSGADQLIYYAQHPYEGEWELWGMSKTTWIYVYIVNGGLLFLLLIALWRVADKTGEEGKQALKGLAAALFPFLGALILLVMLLMVMLDVFPGEEYVSYNNGSWWNRRRYCYHDGYDDDDNDNSYSSSSWSSSSSSSSGFSGGGGSSSGGGNSSSW